jgi:hypothetical protein
MTRTTWIAVLVFLVSALLAGAVSAQTPSDTQPADSELIAQIELPAPDAQMSHLLEELGIAWEMADGGATILAVVTKAQLGALEAAGSSLAAAFDYFGAR